MRNFSKSIFLLQKEGKFLIYFKIEIVAQERFLQRTWRECLNPWQEITAVDEPISRQIC